MSSESYAEDLIRKHYIALKRRYGRLYWWPANTRFEVMVGAILTQNTSWRNVERALGNLRQARKLSLRAIRDLSRAKLQRLIRSSGYYRQKARTLMAVVDFVDNVFQGSLARMFARKDSRDVRMLRERLLEVRGIGRETADAILLYAGKLPVFVVDAYARRVFGRHGAIEADADYESIRQLVERSLRGLRIRPGRNKNLGHRPSRQSRAAFSEDARHLNEFHGLLVHVGKQHCFKTAPDCAHCPLQRFLLNPVTAAATPRK